MAMTKIQTLKVLTITFLAIIFEGSWTFASAKETIEEKITLTLDKGAIEKSLPICIFTHGACATST